MMIRVTSNKYFNSFINDSGFAFNPTIFDTNLAGLVAEYSKAEFEIEIGWESVATFSDFWTISERGVNSYEIVRTIGNFRTDGWSIGNKFDLLVDDRVSSPPNNPDLPYTGTIDYISDDGRTLFVTSTDDLDKYTPYDTHRMRANASDVENQLNSIIYSPNLIENSEIFNNRSLQNDVAIEWFASDIRSGVVQMNPRGINESFDSGDVTIEYLGDIDTYFQQFRISHAYVIHPYYTVQDGLNLPDFLNGTSLKYVFQATFRDQLSNVASSKTFTYENAQGTVGHFGETIDKIKTPLTFTIDNKISTTTTRNFEIVVNGAAFNSNWKYQLIFTYLPTEEEYSADGTFYDNFDYFYESQFAGASSGFPGRISNMSSTFFGSELTINATFLPFSDYDETQEYALFLLIGDTTDHRSRTILKLDETSFDVETANNGLITLTQTNINYNGDTGVTKVHNEDGLAIDFEFDLDLNKEAILTELKGSLVAHNASENKFFYLDEFDFIINPTIINGIQQIETLQSRGYQLPLNNFNTASIGISTNVGGFQKYVGNLGQKISWQDWIANPNVDEIFYDNTKPNNNLNLKSSNYSLKENYAIKMLFEATVRGLDPFGNTTGQKYEFFGDTIEVFDYNEDSNPTPKIVGTIESYTLDGNNIDNVLLGNDEVIFRTTWVGNEPFTSIGGVQATHRIEIFEQGAYQIYELSTNKDDFVASSPLINDNNLLDIRLDGDNIITECRIKGSKLTSNTYSLSSKIIKI